MDANLKASLWQQFGATIETLDNALSACPEHLWRSSMWDTRGGRPERAEVWYLVYHALFWLDLYLDGAEEGFLPPAPFALIEQDGDEPIPDRAYTKDELKAYLGACRSKCRATIEGLTDEAAQRHCAFGWGELSFLELLFYNMRHTQEHASQLNLHLGVNGVSVQDYVTRLGSD